MIKVKAILTIVDVNIRDVLKETSTYLEERHRTYQDLIAREHIINIDDAVEQVDENVNELSEKVINEIRELHKIANENNSSYIRFVEA